MKYIWVKAGLWFGLWGSFFPCAFSESVAHPQTDTTTGMTFVYVAPGKFEMGTKEGDGDEVPEKNVTIRKPFWIGVREVQLSEYRVFLVASGEVDSFMDWRDVNLPFLMKPGYPGNTQNGFGASDNQPVMEVTWYGATAFCTWLTRQAKERGELPEGYEFRLPTEAEWEFAARGGVKAEPTRYAGSDTVEDVAWYLYNAESYTQPTATKKPNELGIYDMSGNVWEWCADVYVVPEEDSDEERRVARGGCWRNDASRCTVTNRYGWEPGHADEHLGFRVVLGPVRSEVAP